MRMSGNHRDIMLPSHRETRRALPSFGTAFRHRMPQLRRIPLITAVHSAPVMKGLCGTRTRSITCVRHRLANSSAAA